MLSYFYMQLSDSQSASCVGRRSKMILNKLLVKLDNHDKTLLCKGLRFVSTLNWSKLVENVEWLNALQHVRKIE